MRCNLQLDIQVARRTFALASVAAAGDTDLRAVVNAGRYRHLERTGTLHAAGAAALAARILDDLPLAVAAGAHAPRDHLAE